MPTQKNVYQLKVTLYHSKPPIWRRILVPENITLYTLHEVIQIVMGWENYHLHAFEIEGQSYGDPEDDEFGSLGTKNEKHFHLNRLGLREKAKFSYEYDFGDSWDHSILVEKILPAEKSAHYPICVTGKRACPPEDVGGIWGYNTFLQTIADPQSEEYDEMLEWVGDEFDPEAFDLVEVNNTLQGMELTPGRQKKREEQEIEENDDFLLPYQNQKAVEDALTTWLKHMSQHQIEFFESLPLRHNVLTFLDYLSKNRTVGTRSTGNLPLKAVQEIFGKFDKSPLMEEAFNANDYKIRSEDDIWSLVFIHSLAYFSNLVTGGQGQTWKATSDGQLFPQLPSPIQVFFLFIHWWVEIDWTIAFSVSGLDNGLPIGFKEHTFTCLNELTVKKYVSFETYADRLIKLSGLTWHSQNQTNAQSIMRTAIEHIVIDIMNSFGVLECEYIMKKEVGYEYKKLANIRLTAIGKEMLGLLKS